MTSLRKIRPRLVISDWDETITKKDTIRHVASIPYHFNPHLTPRFSHYTEIYTDAYTTLRSSYGPCTTLAAHIDFQSRMDAVEATSITAMEKDGIFRGLTRSQLEHAPSLDSIEVRTNAVDLIARCQGSNVPFVVLSANWSSLVIQSVLRRCGLSGVRVVTNELEFDDSGEEARTTGRWRRDVVVRTSRDKLAQVEILMRRAGVSDNVVYVGDSLTDLLPVLNVKYPFVISGSKLEKVLKELNVEGVTYGTWSDFISLIDWST
ncbi:uncharacterized protein LODBEIA_P32170 [Lodderomyces beijingensis]|uniref:HAD-like protein n=1 Tax=Lodderomyces beijingensis TaxID=1775926 RepID=A0ABP0ZLG2_9ASCO